MYVYPPFKKAKIDKGRISDSLNVSFVRKEIVPFERREDWGVRRVTSIESPYLFIMLDDGKTYVYVVNISIDVHSSVSLIRHGFSPDESIFNLSTRFLASHRLKRSWLFKYRMNINSLGRGN